MNEDEGRTFLSRWSRRKIASRQAEGTRPDAADVEAATAQAAPPAAVPGPADRDEAPPAEAPRPLPDVDALRGLESEYRDFLQPEVDQSLRRAALKKLFSDPHFNAMDGLDVYIDDYTKPDPIPPAVLRSLVQARGLKLFEEEKTEEDVAAQQAGAETIAAGEGEPPVAVAQGPTDCPPETEVPEKQQAVPEEARKNG